MHFALILFFLRAIFCEEDVLYGTFTKATGNFVDSSYINTHQITTNDFNYTTSESMDGHPNTYLFINNNTYWVSKEPVNESNPAFITINFHEPTEIEGFVICLAYRSRGTNREFDGSPLKVNIYTSSESNQPITLKHFFNGTYNNLVSEGWTQVQFVFAEPLKCDTLKIEILEVTYDGSFSKDDCCVIRYLLLFEYRNPLLHLAPASPQGNYKNADYIKKHQVPTSFFSYLSSGDSEENPAQNLFDDKTNTYWVSAEPNQGSFTNYLVLNFNGVVSLEGFLYDTAYTSIPPYTRIFHGFPTVLTIYASTNDEPFQLTYRFEGEPYFSWTRIHFIFPELLTCDKIKLEFTTVTPESHFSGGALNVCCGELTFLYHIDEDYDNIANQVSSLFLDYAWLTLNPSFTQEKIDQLQQKAMKYPRYEIEFKPYFDRVETLKTGTIRKDPHREFSTKPGSRNIIEQYGDTASYCRNTLLLSSFGTNRQVIGIGGNTGQAITVFLEVEPNEGVSKESVKLPTMTYTQITGAYQHSFETVTLKLGRNAFIFPDLQTAGTYFVPVPKGGPIHINNPYTLETQGGHVNLYIEGGCVYPVFRHGDDENAFRIILKNYYDRLNDPNDEEIIVDAFEAYSDHVITSCPCTLAYQYYIEKNYSPQENVDRWDNFLKPLLAFGGIPFDKENPKYNPINDHMRQNFRSCQPFGGFYAFAWTEMIGLPDAGSHTHCVYLTSPGWAFPHEFGHTVDKRGRIWGENTNNMWAMYNTFMMDGNIYDRIPITEVATKLGPDLSDYVTRFNETYLMGSNPTIWWFLEGAKPGYWAESENRFLYETSDRDENGNSIINMTERFIYYATLIFGHNMSAYFERWAFCMDQDPIYNVNNRWTYQKSSDNFKQLMETAKSANKFDNELKKYWYINLDQYQYLYDNGNQFTGKEHCYNTNEYITPTDISKSGNTYFISLPEFKCPETHLCYEIQSYINNQWIVLGVTYTQTFSDSYDYQGKTPQYRIYAFDRLLDHTGDPPNDFRPSDKSDPICRHNGADYDSLEEALNAAQHGDTIYLLKSFIQPGIRINKRVSIVPDDSVTDPITITKISPGDLFTFNSVGTGISITIGASDKPAIILDGGGFKQTGSLITTSGTKTIILINVELCNSINTADGGAIYIGYNSQIEMNYCKVQHCTSSSCGGGILLAGGGGGNECILTLNQVTFQYNTAVKDGGAICANGFKGHSRLTTQGCVFQFNVAQGNGGAIWAVKTQSMTNDEFISNRAQNGGAIYVNCVGYEYQVTSCSFSSNVADEKGSSIYLATGTLILNGGTYQGTFHKVDGTLRVNTNKPNVEHLVYTIDLYSDGNPLFELTNVQYSEDELHAIKIQNGYAALDNNIVYAFPSISTITVTYNNQQYTFKVPYGEFTLPSTFEGFPEEYAITQWIGSKTYNTGDSITIDRDFSFSVNVQRFCILTFVYNGKQHTEKVESNTYYYLPMKTPDDEMVFGWEDNKGNYFAYADPVLVTSDLTFTAVLIQKMSVTVIIGDDKQTYQLSYNSFFVLPTPPETFNGMIFKYYIGDDNEQYQPNTTVTVIKDTTYLAYYSNILTVVLIAGDKIETIECPQNDYITLPYPGSENSNSENSGRDFLYWLIEDEKYYGLSPYQVVKNVQGVAVYQIVNKTELITVTYQIPNLSEEYPHYVDGNKTEVKTHSYYDNVTFPGEDYFIKNPGSLGYDRETNMQIAFDYWIINDKKYTKTCTITLTEPINAVLYTKISSIELPTQSPTPEPTETPLYPLQTPEPHEVVMISPDGNVIDTSVIPNDTEKEYWSKIETPDIIITGQGNDRFYLVIENQELEIKETESQFGVNLNKDVSIKLNQENANMNIKGGGSLNISGADNVKDIQINNVVVSQDKIAINTDTKVDSLTLNSLNMYGDAEFDANSEQDGKAVKVKTLIVYEGSTAKITNLQVIEKVELELHATISLTQIDLSNVNEMTVGYSSSIDGKNPSIRGKIGSPPKKISLVEMKSAVGAKALAEKEFIVASGSKEDFPQCSSWKDVVDIEGTVFNQVECKTVGDTIDLVAVTSSDDDPEKFNIKKMMPIIIGAAVGVVVIIIVIIIIVVVVKKKKGLRSVSSDDKKELETYVEDDEL